MIDLPTLPTHLVSYLDFIREEIAAAEPRFAGCLRSSADSWLKAICREVEPAAGVDSAVAVALGAVERFASALERDRPSAAEIELAQRVARVTLNRLHEQLAAVRPSKHAFYRGW